MAHVRDLVCHDHVMFRIYRSLEAGPVICPRDNTLESFMAGFVSWGADPSAYSTHSIRRSLTGAELEAVQLLLGHTKLESTVRYLGIEVAYRPIALKNTIELDCGNWSTTSPSD